MLRQHSGILSTQRANRNMNFPFVGILRVARRANGPRFAEKCPRKPSPVSVVSGAEFSRSARAISPRTYVASPSYSRRTYVWVSEGTPAAAHRSCVLRAISSFVGHIIRITGGGMDRRAMGVAPPQGGCAPATDADLDRFLSLPSLAGGLKLASRSHFQAGPICQP